MVEREYNIADKLGCRTQRIDTMINSTTNTFGYNSKSELIAAALGMDDYGYDYDQIGNRTTASSSVDSVNSEMDYLSNALNQYTNIYPLPLGEGQGEGLCYYDADGNMLTNGDWTYTWNGENRLTMASNATTVVNFKYDYMGRRFEKSVEGGTTKTFIYDGWNPIAEIASSLTNYYTWGLDLSGSLQGLPVRGRTQTGAGGIGGLLSTVQDGDIYFSCFDANGNVTDYVDETGDIVAHYEYDPFGGIILANGDKKDDFNFRFSTKYLDIETDLYYYGYRYYILLLGRFINMDPVDDIGLPERLALGISISDDSLVEIYSREIANSYRYADNMPIGNIDALGFKTTSSCGACKNGDVFGLMQDPKWKYDIDGCSVKRGLVPFATDSWDKDNPVGWCSFYAACAAHDKCYQTCNNQTGDSRTKDWCDNMLEKNMKRACDRCVAGRYYQEGSLRGRMYTSAHIAKERCYAHANSYALGVRVGADAAWKKRQEETCTLCCCP